MVLGDAVGIARIEVKKGEWGKEKALSVEEWKTE